ncbi:YkgJ family cysteine cluster protein [Cellvibrio sp. OA-2007]|uniref:YkgJ family cysteine cluster protein n=1 Tax=Cellvibrio sp. OA-2007 TaxID=529823 RepID=UPI000A063278|nr:YkgJ family cysteine cluster protein [Cellvibrio sp. OA-2007]
MPSESPCLTCGACCANFRVSFYWGECQSAGGTIPDELTLQISPHHACMKGTEKNPVKCVALVGTPGEHVSCSIYEQRSSTCREFDMWNADGSVNEACTRARAVYGLPPVDTQLELIIVAQVDAIDVLPDSFALEAEIISVQPESVAVFSEVAIMQPEILAAHTESAAPPQEAVTQTTTAPESLVIADNAPLTPDTTHL